MSKLTPRQHRFVAEYVSDLNATRAAIRAGYSSKTANEQGSRLLRNVSVSEAIARAAHRHMLRAEVTVQEVIAGLHREATHYGEASSHSARVAAWTQLGRYHQLFVDRIEKTVTNQLSDLSDEELDEWIQRIAAGEDIPEFLQ